MSDFIKKDSKDLTRTKAQFAADLKRAIEDGAREGWREGWLAPPPQMSIGDYINIKYMPSKAAAREGKATARPPPPPQMSFQEQVNEASTRYNAYLEANPKQKKLAENAPAVAAAIRAARATEAARVGEAEAAAIRAARVTKAMEGLELAEKERIKKRLAEGKTRNKKRRTKKFKRCKRKCSKSKKRNCIKKCLSKRTKRRR